MKKLMLILVLALSSIYAYSEEYMLFSGSAYTFNEYSKSLEDIEYQFKYDDIDKIYYFYTSDIIYKSWVRLSTDDIDLFRKNLEKYFEWEKIAIDNKAKIEKQLPNSTIETSVFWKSTSDWYSSYDFYLYFTFFSQNESRHQLVIYSNKAKSTKNEYIDHKIEDIYLDKDAAKYLYDNISNESILKVIKEHEGKKNIEELFK